MDYMEQQMDNLIQAGIHHRDDMEAEIARLTAELEVAEGDLAWMKDDRNRWQDCATQRHYRVKSSEEERDAIAAAAFEVAAVAVINCIPVEAERTARQNIRALTPADAKAALDRMLREAKAEGMRECLAIVEDGDCFDPASAILSRAKDMEAGNG